MSSKWESIFLPAWLVISLVTALVVIVLGFWR